jgi:non-ribosomal peptide synthetase component F
MKQVLLPAIRLDEPGTEPGMSPPGGASPIPATMLDHLLVEAAIQCPEADALVGDFGRLTYADLLIRAQNIAVVLKRHGVGSGHCVAVAMTTSPVILTAIAGIVLAGAAYVPLAATGSSTLLRKVRANGVSILLWDGSDPLAQRNLCESWKGLGTLLDASRMEQETMPSSGETHLNPISPDATAVLFVDADGERESVRATHRSLARMVSAGRVISTADRLMKFDAGETFLLDPGDPRRSGLFHLWGSLLHGACLALAPEALTPAQFAEWIRWHGVSVLSLPVARVAECVDRAPETFSHLRALFIETDGKTGAIAPQRIEWLQKHYPGLRIVHTYSTECVAGYATAYRIPENYKAQAAVPIGLPLQGLQVGILGPARQPVRAGEIGELVFTGVDGGEDKPCFTGERARMRADGLLELHGHAQPLTSLLATSTAAIPVEAREAATADERTTQPLTPETNFKKLPTPHTPSENRAIEVVSRESNSDHDQLLNAERYHEKVLEQVRSLWLRLLRRNTIGYEEDFFEAGGTRVQLIRMHAELNRRFPGAITMRELAVLTTIRKIYEHLVTDAADKSESTLVRRGA